MELDIRVNGIPAPQGSKKGFPIRRKNGSIGVAITESAGDKVTTWRHDVRAAAERSMEAQNWATPLNGTGATLDLLFFMPRPKGHYGSGRNAGILRDAAPDRHVTKPDLDKLIRAVMDALTSAGVYTDDSTVSTIHAMKMYADAGPTGAHIIVQAHDLDSRPSRKDA